MIRLLLPHPALMVESREKVLLVADLHLGLEYDLAKQGINIPFQWSKILEKLIMLLKKYTPDRLIILGDVKHSVPATSFKEKQEIPQFFNSLFEYVEKIDVTRGNHDANIQKLLPEKVTLHNSKGVIFGEDLTVAGLHGHAWPPPEILMADYVVMAHNHPTVMLKTPIGLMISQRVWIRGKIHPINLSKIYLEQIGVSAQKNPLENFKKYFIVNPAEPELIIMPMFNDLLGGLSVNMEAPKKFLGPLFRSGIVDLESFDTYLLDGTYLGKIGFLRKQINVITLNYS
jgi:putative SbcD/Mre11-related phosphoesterase